MEKVAIVTFDKVSGLTVVGENLIAGFTSLKEAFAFASECERNPYIQNVKLDRFDNAS